MQKQLMHGPTTCYAFVQQDDNIIYKYMDQIQDPRAKKIWWLLLPLIVYPIVMNFINHTLSLCILGVAAVCAIIYIWLITQMALREKCYNQLAIICGAVIAYLFIISYYQIKIAPVLEELESQF